MTTPPRSTKLRLPPLNRIRAFDAAARHLNFTKAAEELGVTQGAVSHSVKALEDYLRLSLFDRTVSGLELNEASAAYARAIHEGLSRIHEATERLVSTRSNSVLTVRGYTSFQMYWLVPHLPDFQIHHPDIEVRLISANDKTRLDNSNVDVRIRLGYGRWSDTENVFLFSDDLVPVCSPDLLEAGTFHDPLVLGKMTLLHSSHRLDDWAEWLAGAGHAGLRPKASLVFEELSVVYQAAMSGIGVALSQFTHVQKDLQSGRLISPFVFVLRRERGYYMTYKPERRDLPRISAFKQWITKTLERERPRAGR